jgi:proline racemase
MAVLHAWGLLAPGQSYIGRSIIESRFTGRMEAETTLAGKPAIIPSISGRAWISGRRTEMLDPADPWPLGYKLSDTWPRIGK